MLSPFASGRGTRDRHTMLRYFAILVLFAATGCSGCDDLGDPDLDGCGDGVVRGGETCDGDDLAGLTCADFGFTQGELSCAPTCAGVIVAGCHGVPEPDRQACRSQSSCVAQCRGEGYLVDRRLDFDITTVPTTFELTRAGASLPPAQQEARGTLELRGAVWWEPVEVDVPATGPATVELDMVPDTYEVVWHPARPDVIGPLSLGTVEITEQTDHVFDLAPLRAVQIRVTINGAPFGESPFDQGARGAIVLERSGTRSFVVAALPDDGPPVTSAQLEPGDYDIWWVRDDSTIEFIAVTTVNQTNSVEVDLPLVRIEPRVTLNRLPPALPIEADFDASLNLENSRAGPARSWTQWRRPTVVSLPVDRTGLTAASWILKGEYDVRLEANAPRLQGTLHLRNALMIDDTEDAAHFDVPLTAVSGTVARNGRRVPASQLAGTPRGRLIFERQDGSYVATEIDGSGPPEFRLALPPGQWKVRAAGDPWSATLPLVSTTIRESLVVGSSAIDDLALDVPAVRFLGQLTLDGERMPDEVEGETRGSLEIRAHDGKLGYNLPISRTGPALFDVLLAPDQYDVQVARWWFAVGGSPPPDGVLPLGTWSVGTVDVSATVQRDVDLRTFDARIELQERGDRLAETDSTTRGELWVEDVEIGRVSRHLDIPADGRSEVSTTLYPGTYRVVFQPDPSMDTLPLQPVLLGTMRVGEDVEQRFDVGGITLTGTVTVNGEPLREGPDGRGTISFLRFPTVADTTVDADVDPDFELTAAPGPYNVLFHPAPNHPQLPHGAILLSDPCVDRRLVNE